MHELSITQSMLDLVLEQAEKAEAKNVGKINLYRRDDRGGG